LATRDGPAHGGNPVRTKGPDLGGDAEHEAPTGILVRPGRARQERDHEHSQNASRHGGPPSASIGPAPSWCELTSPVARWMPRHGVIPGRVSLATMASGVDRRLPARTG